MGIDYTLVNRTKKETFGADRWSKWVSRDDDGMMARVAVNLMISSWQGNHIEMVVRDLLDHGEPPWSDYRDITAEALEQFREDNP